MRDEAAAEQSRKCLTLFMTKLAGLRASRMNLLLCKADPVAAPEQYVLRAAVALTESRQGLLPWTFDQMARADLLTGSYDCVDRIVLKAYYPLDHNPGGFRVWWRRLHGDSDELLDNTHLMRMAGRFSRRLRALWGARSRAPM
jgi:hypothetical protein